MIQAASFVEPWQSRDNVGSSLGAIAPEPRQGTAREDLLLRETNHRWSNDLQLVVGLLDLQSKHAVNVEVRQALATAAERVSVLARSRRALYCEQQRSLDRALQQVCEALHTQAELRSISLLLKKGDESPALSEQQITILALAVNELATNAIKHAFQDGRPGWICISTGMISGREVTVTVEDDGRPFPEVASRGAGMGMRLVHQLMASIGGVLIPPSPGMKLFELRVPRRSGPVSESDQSQDH